MTESVLTPIEIGTYAAIVTVEHDEPAILVTSDESGPHAGLPFGPFDPLAHRTFEIGLRAFVEAQTALSVGYVEQLYTFGDRGRHARPDDTGRTWCRLATWHSRAYPTMLLPCEQQEQALSPGTGSSLGGLAQATTDILTT
jgi:hypothetical protein